MRQLRESIERNEGLMDSLRDQLAQKDERLAAVKGVEDQMQQKEIKLIELSQQIKTLQEELTKANGSTEDESRYDLEVNIAYLEKSVQDNTQELMLAHDQISIMQDNWNEDKTRMLDYQNKFCSSQIAVKDLSRKLTESLSQLAQSRNLNSIPVSTNVPMSGDGEKTSQHPNKQTTEDDESRKASSHSDDKVVVIASDCSKSEVCLFELTGEGRCKRKSTCKYNHDIPESMKDKEAMSAKLSELSKKLGKCTYEMVEKGSCPEKHQCVHPHLIHRSGKKVPKRRLCFKEMEAPGSCDRGPNCRFSHEMSEDDRKNENLREQVHKEKMSKKGICINEFRKKGSCHKGTSCLFRHEIRDEERGSPELKEKMDERWEQMNGRSKTNLIKDNISESMTSMEMLKEFRNLMMNFNKMINKQHTHRP